MTFAGAAAYCSSLSLGGVSWRVPSYKELLTLVDENPHFEYSNGDLVLHAIDANAFLGTAVDQPYWTSSTFPDPQHPSASAYAVYFSDGRAEQWFFTQNNIHVRCVSPR
jgi:hypothetical protein